MQRMELAEDNSLPLWMKNMQQRENLAKAKAEADRQRELAALMRIDLDGPLFWDRLTREIKRQAELFESIGIRGFALVTGSVESEVQCNIEVAPSDSLYPKMARISYFYRKGQTGIRVFSSESKAPDFHFQIYPDGLRLIAKGSSVPLNPEQAADIVLEWIVSKVKE